MTWKQRLSRIKGMLAPSEMQLALLHNGIGFRAKQGGVPHGARLTLCEDGVVRSESGVRFRGNVLVVDVRDLPSDGGAITDEAPPDPDPVGELIDESVAHVDEH